MRKNIFKKLALLSTMVAASSLFCGYTPVSGDGNPDEWDIDNTQYVYDYADVFTDSEELKLQEMCEETGKELGLDLVIVTSRDLGKGDSNSYVSDSTVEKYEREYADDFYDYGGYSDSGVLYLLDLDYDGIYVSTAGLGMVYIDDYDVETLLDAIWEEYYDYYYYESAEAFVETVEDIVKPRMSDGDFEDLEEAWNKGNYSDYDDFKRDYNDDILDAYAENFFTKFKSPLISAGVAAVIALIAVLIMCFKSSTKMTAGSRTYLKNGSFNVLQRYDRFTHTTTTSHRVNTSSGGGGGGSRGHSSSHRSSSGRSHGGGGRRR